MSNDSEAENPDEETGAETGDETGAAADPDAGAEPAEADPGAEAADAGSEADAGTDAGSDTQAEEEDEPEGLQEGDFIRLDYTARTVEGGDLVDTTDPQVAEEEDVDADREFEPRTIVLGEGHIFPSVEDDIIGKEVGDVGSVVVPASEAFGERDEEEVRTVSKDKIPEDDRYPGAQVEVDGQQGFVETIIGGRARVDFNHPLAGADIEYEYEVVDEIVDRQAKAEGLLKTRLDLDLDVHFQTDTVEEERLVEDDDEDVDEEEQEAEEGEGEAKAEEVEDEDEVEDEVEEPEYETVEVEKESLYIKATPMLNMDQQWMFRKQEIADDLIDFLDLDRVVIQEILEGTGGMGGMPGMMGGMGGMGGAGDEELEAALDEADVDADELVEELEEP